MVDAKRSATYYLSKINGNKGRQVEVMNGLVSALAKDHRFDQAVRKKPGHSAAAAEPALPLVQGEPCTERSLVLYQRGGSRPRQIVQAADQQHMRPNAGGTISQEEREYRFRFKKFMEDPKNKTPSPQEAKNALTHLPWLKKTFKDPHLCLYKSDPVYKSIIYYKGHILQEKRPGEYACLKAVARERKLDQTQLCHYRVAIRCQESLFEGKGPFKVQVRREYGAHGQHTSDLDHYLKVQFLYNRDSTAQIKQTLHPLLQRQQQNQPLAIMDEASTCNQVALVDDTEMQIALINPEGIDLGHEGEKRVFAKTLGAVGLAQLRKERRDQKQKQKLDSVVGRFVKRLSLEQQLRTIMPEHVTMRGIEIADPFLCRSDRQGFLIYDAESGHEANRLKHYTNRTVYIEATLPRMTEQNYEVWLLRLFHPGLNQHVTFGMVLIPREFLYNVKMEPECIYQVFGAIYEEFDKMEIQEFMISTKRSIHFISRIRDVVTDKISADIRVKMCFSNYQDKLLALINDTMPKTDDQNYLNLQERELLFHLLKSLLFLPKDLIPKAIPLLRGYIDANFSTSSLMTFERFLNHTLAPSEHYPISPKLTQSEFPTHLLTLISLVDEYGPLSLCYDVDWPQNYHDCYKLREQSQSRPLPDLLSQVWLREVHNLQRMIFSFRQDFNIATFDTADQNDQNDRDGFFQRSPLVSEDAMVRGQRERYEEKLESGGYLYGLNKLARMDRLQRMRKARMLKVKRESELGLLGAQLEANAVSQMQELQSFEDVGPQGFDEGRLVPEMAEVGVIQVFEGAARREIVMKKWQRYNNELVLLYLTKFARFFQNLDTHEQQ